MQSAAGSFAKFTIGFLVFISLSLGLTVGVEKFAKQKDKAEMEAAALRAMLDPLGE